MHIKHFHEIQCILFRQVEKLSTCFKSQSNFLPCRAKSIFPIRPAPSCISEGVSVTHNSNTWHPTRSTWLTIGTQDSIHACIKPRSVSETCVLEAKLQKIYIPWLPNWQPRQRTWHCHEKRPKHVTAILLWKHSLHLQRNTACVQTGSSKWAQQAHYRKRKERRNITSCLQNPCPHTGSTKNFTPHRHLIHQPGNLSASTLLPLLTSMWLKLNPGKYRPALLAIACKGYKQVQRYRGSPLVQCKTSQMSPTPAIHTPKQTSLN